MLLVSDVPLRVCVRVCVCVRACMRVREFWIYANADCSLDFSLKLRLT